MTVRRGLTIGFSGAGGTGKTTSAAVLAKDLDIPILTSASRIVYEEQELSEELVYKMDAEEKWDLQRMIFNKKIEMDDGTPSFVADRTLLDHWVYCLLYCGKDMSKEEFHHMENMVRKHMLSNYSHLFYFPWGHWEADPDGVRQDAPGWQSSIDALIVGYCIRWNLPMKEVPQHGGPEIRDQFIKAQVLGQQAQ